MFYFTDNPALDALKYDNDIDEEIAGCRKCSCCEAPIYPGEAYFDIDGQIFCPSCMESMRKTEHSSDIWSW